MRLTLALIVCLAVALPAAARQHPPESVAVDFGILALAPIGPLPCLQTTGIGGPADPCAYKLHVLVPDEAVVRKGGEVTFQVHGGGHGFAIYEVSKHTTRDQVGQLLCPGDDPATIAVPALHACNGSAANANAQHVVTDAKDNVVLVAEANPMAPPVPHPHNRVWSEPGRLASAGAHQFLNGGTIPAGATSNGQLITYRFEKTGRYLVICINRSHFLNDWMFGFVDVVE